MRRLASITVLVGLCLAPRAEAQIPVTDARSVPQRIDHV